MTWQQAKCAILGSKKANVNPYENWELETRNPDVSSITKTKGWHPVYVRLLEKKDADNPYFEAARRVLSAILFKNSGLPYKEQLAIDMVSLDFLFQAAGARDDRFASFFVWRRNNRAYENINGVFEVVHVGPQSSALCDLPELMPEEDARATLETFEKMSVSGVQIRNDECDLSKVITGVIDDQIGFAHERFRKAAKKTRIEGHFVHQQEAFLGDVIDRPAPGFILVGGMFNEDQINNLLKANDEVEIYRKTDDLAQGPQADFGNALVDFFLGASGEKLLEKGFTPLREHRTSHGTYITDVSAGHPVEAGVEDRPIMTFDLSRLSTADTSGTRLDVHSVLAVMFMTGVAHRFLGKKPSPMVINFSYALRAGPKDGTGFAEAEMARLVRDRHRNCAPTWLVLPSGNGFRDQCHALLSPERGQTAEVEWQIQPGDQTPSYVEIWTEPVEGGTVTVTPPGHQTETFELITSACDWDLVEGSRTIARVFRQYVNNRIRITIAVAATLNSDEPDAAAPSGAWLISAHAQDKAFAIHLDVQRDDTPDGYPRYGRQSYFDGANLGALDPDTMEYTAPAPSSEPVQREYTLSSYGTNDDDHVLVAGGAFDRDTFSQAALYAASGPGLDGRAAPELSAVSEETRTHPARLAAGMYSGSVGYYSGTSTAAALETRRIVEAVSADLSLDKSGLITALLEPQSPKPARDLQLGYGTAPYQLEPGRIERRCRG